MKIEVDGGGKVNLAAPQGRWYAQDEPEVMQEARFAGQILSALRDDDSGCVDLHYLGFTGKGFPSMDAAQSAAPAFAREVLRHMAALIEETQPPLRKRSI